jgi:hypothetical protein
MSQALSGLLGLTLTAAPSSIYSVVRFADSTLTRLAKCSAMNGTSTPVCRFFDFLRKMETLQVGMETPHAGMETPHAGMETPHAGMGTPHAGMATPHAGMATPHAGMATLQAGMATPHAGMATLQAGMATPHAGITTLRPVIRALQFGMEIRPIHRT